MKTIVHEESCIGNRASGTLLQGRARGPDGTTSSAVVFGFSTVGRRNGFCLTSFVTLPERMHWVQTSSDVLVPCPTVTRRRWRFGLNFRREMPVTFVPTPPRYFALPRIVTVFPMENPLPQTSQERATVDQPVRMG